MAPAGTWRSASTRRTRPTQTLHAIRRYCCSTSKVAKERSTSWMLAPSAWERERPSSSSAAGRCCEGSRSRLSKRCLARDIGSGSTSTDRGDSRLPHRVLVGAEYGVDYLPDCVRSRIACFARAFDAACEDPVPSVPLDAADVPAHALLAAGEAALRPQRRASRPPGDRMVRAGGEVRPRRVRHRGKDVFRGVPRNRKLAGDELPQERYLLVRRDAERAVQPELIDGAGGVFVPVTELAQPLLLALGADAPRHRLEEGEHRVVRRRAKRVLSAPAREGPVRGHGELFFLADDAGLQGDERVGDLEGGGRCRPLLALVAAFADEVSFSDFAQDEAAARCGDPAFRGEEHERGDPGGHDGASTSNAPGARSRLSRRPGARGRGGGHTGLYR